MRKVSAFQLYKEPQTEVLLISDKDANLLCSSPTPGENESLTYEEWKFDDNYESNE